jgi:uracil-DNA glycosylase
MRHALNALTEELRRLKAAGQGSVSISDEGLAALRRSVEAGPRKASAETDPEPARPAPKAAAKPEAAKTVAPVPAAAPPVVVLPQGDKPTRWAALNRIVMEDPVCKARLRPGKKLVTGVGALDAGIMFVGEAPGAEEEVQGEPFVGPAGQLLNKMIGGMALSRAEVYIGNIMNWRPEMPTGPDGIQVGNRPPTDAEMAHCLPYLIAQIEVVGPQILVALGTSAAKGLLGPKAFGALGEVRGKWHEFGGRPLMVTYHPSYILRNPTNRTKRLIWEDLLKVMERAKLPISEKQRAFFLS